ncbi:hypothetical protein SEHO0A_02555 [Salmonella enterica subsp. houtenae str. ATCC BAA-1581]|nr:hypothetical protein SEHO0A_02555 [Salmonella enterica subsp. houtenae str. ATCC BAA-1581]ENZ86088.1 hypothetical protein D088_950016 [Salmonella enterica subsp. houtenae serovar 16:z4,z32:-- str. RKS3027]
MTSLKSEFLLLFLFFVAKKYFHSPLDRKKMFRLFSKGATIVAASLGRSGR